MNWKILNQIESFEKENVVRAILENRGLKNKKEIEEFLNPIQPNKFSASDLGIDRKELTKAVKRINRAIEKGESIVVYGDYDADGICATAILWESLYRLSKKVLPYIPERVSEGYGLNKKSISQLKEKDANLKLLITVDHGITAAEKIKYAQGLGIDVIVCDHHQLEEKKPECQAVVHTDQVCAAAIAWFLARGIYQSQKKACPNFLDLVAIATIADLEPLLGVNRSLVKYGLQALNKTKRCGLLAIFEEAGIKPGTIDTYEVGFIIGPRLNAAGRMEHALESLRLVCTPKSSQAQALASKLGLTNQERQVLTEETAKHARELLLEQIQGEELPKLIFVSHESYQEGVIGLAASKLTEEFYRPSIVISQGEVYSKASARSINGFNIIEAIRTQSNLLVDVGGHPMAAGFTLETARIEELKKGLALVAEEEIDSGLLERSLKIDLELPLSALSLSLWQELANLKPFGLANPQPVFKSQ
ncbi:MAG TPA: single-stranded-DNA-specific exonuclease RecJ, partial [Clostridia bacterium]|nr:single-stranded-DNA-specific exonuclease RecJ [Clostridia bacterium]